MALKLYDLAGAEEDRRFSPYCWRAKMALKHKGLEFETIPWRFTEKDVIAPFNAKTVPVLIDGNQAIPDSWAIALYLDQAYPQRPSLFGSNESRTLTDFVAQWAFRVLHVALLRLVVLDIYARIAEKDKPYFRESREKRFGKTLEAHAGDPKEALAAFRVALDPVRPVLVQNQFLCGNGPGFADYIVFGAFQWARCISPTRLLEPDDPVYAWRDRLLKLYDGYAARAKGYPVWA